MLDEISSVNNETCSAVMTVIKVLLEMENTLTQKITKSSLAILFSENEKYKEVLESELNQRSLLYECLSLKSLNDENEARQFGDYLFHLAKTKVLNGTQCW